VVDRFLAGLRNQGPGAIPALILSLLALGGAVFWLLSRDDERPTRTVEVIGAPTPVTTTQAALPPTVGPGSGSGSSASTDKRRARGGGHDGGPATVPAPPAPPGSSAGSDTSPPAEPVGPATGGRGAQPDEPPILDEVQRLLRGGDRTAGGDDNTLLQSVRNGLLR